MVGRRAVDRAEAEGDGVAGLKVPGTQAIRIAGFVDVGKRLVGAGVALERLQRLEAF